MAFKFMKTNKYENKNPISVIFPFNFISMKENTVKCPKLIS